MSASPIYAARIQIEHLTNPIGIDYICPEIEWLPVGAKSQTAFRIVETAPDGTLLSDSGKVLSSATTYQPKAKKHSRDIVSVWIELWDEEDKKGEIRFASYELGLTKASDFKAKWIDPELKPSRGKHPSYLRKRFNIKSADTARLYMTAHGMYSFLLNGKRVTDQCLTPGFTQYDKRLQVQTYDITDALRVGENELCVQLSDGIWRGPMGYMRSRNSFGTSLALLAQLEVDGEIICVTDETWEASQHGPVTAEDTMCYEKNDARREDPIRWHGVKVEDFGYDTLIGCDAPPVLAHEAFKPTVLTTPKGETVLDFGQNMAGFISFRIEGKAGQRIRLVRLPGDRPLEHVPPLRLRPHPGDPLRSHQKVGGFLPDPRQECPRGK